MYASDDPSPYIANIFYESEIKDALKELPDISIGDFLCERDEKHECQRAHEA